MKCGSSNKRTNRHSSAFVIYKWNQKNDIVTEIPNFTRRARWASLQELFIKSSLNYQAVLPDQTRLTYLISSLGTGGAERGMARLITEINDEYEVTVVALRGGDQDIVGELPGCVRVIDLDVQSVRDARGLQYLWSELVKTDILVCSLYHAALIGTITGRLAYVPTILCWRHNESFKNRLRQTLFHFAITLSDQVLADSEPVAQVLEQTYGHIGKVSTVPIAGVDTDRFAPRNIPGDTNRDDTVVGILGTLRAQKNHDAVLAVADCLHDEPIRFEIAGKGPREDELRNRVNELGLKNVQFRGFVDNPPAFLNSLDVYVQPSHHEGLCITAIEAMACGLPVVAAAVGGLKKSIVHGETGYLFSPGDHETFVNCIRDLHASPARREHMGVRARQRVINHYTRNVLVKEFNAALASGED